jgi:hypothetical protein
MSLIITVKVREGIVMSSDSRITLNMPQPGQVGPQVNNLSIGISDSHRKLFVTSNGVGISTCGDASIAGAPIAGFVDSFITSINANQSNPNQTAHALLVFFRAINQNLLTIFHVSGYNQNSSEIWSVDIQNNQVTQINMPIFYGGESDVISRLFQQVAQLDTNGNWQPLPSYSLTVDFFTLQDAIDFCIYATRTTIDTIRFQGRGRTVGGPIDILVIRQNGYEWVSQKKLHA